MVGSAERRGETIPVSYPFKPGPYSSHTLLLRSLPEDGAGRRVLDIGSGDGQIGAQLVARGYRVTGIEKPGLAPAQGFEVIEADLDLGLPPLPGKFAFILCGDVLEHLRDPLGVLRALRGLLEPGGRLVASLPNSGNIYFRLNVLLGRFPVHERGLFDRTHLRFYTWKGWTALLERGRFRIETTASTGIPVGLALPRWASTLPVRCAERLCYDLARLWKTMFAYQFVVIARPDDPA